MNRLLQGDVGSGKTIVAAQAAVIAVENGYQAVLLAPTEILAAQHFLNLQRIFKPLDYRVMPLTGSMSKKEKETIKRSLSTGFAQIAVGTHALLEQDVEFHKLGLAIIDEQHRFGVLQRKALQQKGFSPDSTHARAHHLRRSRCVGDRRPAARAQAHPDHPQDPRGAGAGLQFRTQRSAQRTPGVHRLPGH
jgi:ATP-dependent DNA helicase RecG